MRLKHQDLLAQVLTALFIAFLLARLLAVSQHYPYYFIWDMDYVSTLDTMLINSQILPDHINHPGFGMYLVQALSERAGQSLAGLSAIRLPDLAASLNPLAATAELTAYLRLHTPYLEVALVLLLWAGLNLILKPGRWLSLAFLAALGLQESLVYQASMIRTELYAMFFWGGAFCLMALSVRSRSQRAWRLWLLGAGVLLGLCLLTKIQAIFHLLAFGVLAVLSATLAPRPDAPWRQEPARRDVRMLAILGAVNLGNFLLLLLIAILFVPIPKAFATFAQAYTINPITLLFGLGGLGLAAGQIYYLRTGRAGRPEFALMSGCTLVFTGFLAAFLLHFLLFENPLKSIHYLLYDFKMVFFREFSSQQQASLKTLTTNFPVNPADHPPADVKNDPWGIIMYHPALFFTHLGLLVTLLAGSLNRFIAVTRRQAALCAALTLLAAALLVLGVRFYLRDLLWVEMLLTVLNLYYFMMIWRGARRHARQLRLAAAGAGLLVLALTTAHSLDMTRRINMNYNLYGWDLNKYRYKVFDNNQRKYQDLLDQFYAPVPRMWDVAESFADTQDWRRDAAQFVFQNLAVTQREVGIVSEGFPVWTRNTACRISYLPEELRGAIVVDCKSLPLRDHYFSRREYTQTYSEYMQKIKPAPSSGEFGAPLEWLSVLKRQDLKILLFLQSEDLARLHAEELAPATVSQDSAPTTGTAAAKRPPVPLKIRLRKLDPASQETIELQGVEVRNSADLHVSLIRRDYFFVLKVMRH